MKNVIMIKYQIELIQDQEEIIKNALLELNNTHAEQTSYLTSEKWETLLNNSFSATCISDASAFLISFEHDSLYNNINFKWFLERYSHFIYIDRIVVLKKCQGTGIAKLLYQNLYLRALEAGHDLVLCEVNIISPNPVSNNFHLKMGFSEVGSVKIKATGKTVKYLAKKINEDIIYD